MTSWETVLWIEIWKRRGCVGSWKLQSVNRTGRWRTIARSSGDTQPGQGNRDAPHTAHRSQQISLSHCCIVDERISHLLPNNTLTFDYLYIFVLIAISSRMLQHYKVPRVSVSGSIHNLRPWQYRILVPISCVSSAPLQSLSYESRASYRDIYR